MPGGKPNPTPTRRSIAENTNNHRDKQVQTCGDDGRAKERGAVVRLQETSTGTRGNTTASAEPVTNHPFPNGHRGHRSSRYARWLRT